MGIMNIGLSEHLQDAGFSADPFADSTDEGPFFLTPQLDQRLNLIHHLVRFSDLLLLVTGPKGSGKSTLLNRLTANPREPWHVSVVEGHVEMNSRQLWQRALAGFDVPEAKKKAVMGPEALSPYLEQWKKRAQPAVLAIDDAHLLPPATLAELLGQARDMVKGHLRFVLLGEPRLEEKIGDTVYQTDRMILHVVDLPPLTEKQTAQYIRFRLQGSGLEAGELFSENVVRRLRKDSGGLPEAINQRARNILADGLATGHSGHATQHPSLGYAPAPRRNRLPTVLVLAAMAGVATWLLIEPRDTPPPEPLLLPAPKPPDSAPIVSHALEPAVTREVPPTPRVPEPTVTAEIAPPQSPQTEQKAASPPATLPEPPEPAALPEPATPEPSQQATTAEAPTPAALDPPPAAQPAVPPKPKARTEPDKAWLFSQKPEHYTIQLTGTRERQAAIDFIATHRLTGKAAWLRTLHKNQDWYVVISGTYPSREAAVSGIASLPATLRRYQPWARSFGSMLQSIRDSKPQR